MTIGGSHKPQSISILSSSIIRKIKDVRKQYYSNNVHIVAIDRFGFKVEKHIIIYFFAEKKHLIIIFIYLCNRTSSASVRRCVL